VSFELLSVDIVDRQVHPGQEAQADITWHNQSDAIFRSYLRWDLRRTGLWATWIEGPWVYIGAYPRQTVTTRVGCVVPPDWPNGMPVDARLMLQGVEGAIWSGEDVYTTGMEASYDFRIGQPSVRAAG